MIAFDKHLPSMENKPVICCVLICKLFSCLCGNMRENSIFQVVFVYFCIGKDCLTVLKTLYESAPRPGLCTHNDATRD